MTKIFLVACEEFSFPDKNGSGDLIQGWSYIGFLPNGNAIKFSSQDNGHKVYAGEVGYDAERAIDIDLRTKIWDGKVRYSEVVKVGEDGD